MLICHDERYTEEKASGDNRRSKQVVCGLPSISGTPTCCITSSTAVSGHSVEVSSAFKKDCGSTISTGAGRYP